MPSVYGPLDLIKNELRQAVVQNLGSAPAAPVKGLLYFNSADNILYWYNGTGWVAAQGGAGAVPATTVTTQAIGDAGVVGVGTLYARDDHKHGMPAFGTVTQETTFGATASAGSAVTLARADHMHGNPTHDAAAHATIPVSTFATATAVVNMGGFKITNMADPTLVSDAATKQYVDTAIAGLSWKDAARLASTANVATLSGVQTIDSIATVAGDIVLLKNQTTPSQNGLYVALAGAWVRSTFADTEAELLGAAVFVTEGTVNADTAWLCSTNAPITVGTTGLTWVQFSGAGTYAAGAGLTLTANTFDVGAGTGITVAADTVAVDTTVIATQSYVTTAITGMAKRYVAALTGTASPEVVTHNLNTNTVLVQVIGPSNQAVHVDWTPNTVNAITLTYNPNLGAGCRIIVVG